MVEQLAAANRIAGAASADACPPTRRNIRLGQQEDDEGSEGSDNASIAPGRKRPPTPPTLVASRCKRRLTLFHR